MFGIILQWKESYSVHVKEIDNQHKILFEISNRILEKVYNLKNGYKEFDEIFEILDELKDYTDYHFNYEEALLLKHSYPECESQEMEHDFFIKRLNKIDRPGIENIQPEVLDELIVFLTDWIATHILQNDMKYKDFLNSKGVT
jgi:hemerythrin